MKEFWLKVKSLAHEARRAHRASGSQAIVRVEKRAASAEDIAKATRRVVKDHEKALRWLADK